MAWIHDIPEIDAWRSSRDFVRIPPALDVPLTPRVRRIIDTRVFRRLARISQLGLVSLVYPAANHSRQEHSLGVYRVAIQYLCRLAAEPRFLAAIDVGDVDRLLLAALLHDIGHWPYCHPIEDICLPAVPTHEQFARSFLLSDELSAIVRGAWNTSPEEVHELLAGKSPDNRSNLLRSILSGPIDVDKVDYLMRDSLHAGVPYGRNFDQARLIASLCLNAAGDGLAISEKGKTAAEMMVFARYVMFSEVYWHHAVRAATAMLQRAFYLLHDALDLNQLFVMTEPEMTAELRIAGQGRAAGELLAGIFGPSRQLYKRLAQYSYIEQPAVYAQLAQRPFPWLVQCAENIAEVLAEKLGQNVPAHEVLIDAPPLELEVEFDMDVFYPKEQVYRRLGDVSPVVRTLARRQFDNYVKRVRIFVHPRLRGEISQRLDVADLVTEAVTRARP